MEIGDRDWRSSAEQWTTSFAKPGVYTIRLEVSSIEGDCEGVIYTKEKVISVRCLEDEAIRLSIPERMLQDSCYEISITGITDLSWQFGDSTGTSNTIELCPSISRLQSMNISYGSGACKSNEELHFMVYPNEERSRSYFHQRMRFDRDTSSSQDFIKLYEVGEDSYRLIGAENYARDNTFLQDTHQNFIRTWFPFEQEGYDWELYKEDTLSIRPDFDDIFELQINYLDMIEDSLDGSKYYLGLEHYASSRSAVFVLGKLNVLGKPVWTKRIHLPDYPYYEGKQDNNKYLHFMGDTLLMNLNQILCKVDKKGNVIQAIGLDRHPVGLYDRPMHSSQLGIVVKGGKIFYDQFIVMIDTSLYPIHTDSINNIRESTVWTGILDKDLNLESSKFYDYEPRAFQFGRNSFTVTEYKGGSLIYWYQVKASEREMHLLHLDDENNVRKYKVLKDLDFPLATLIKPNLHILDNDEILLSVTLNDGKKMAVFKMDSDLQNVESFGYEIPYDPLIFEFSPDGLSSSILRADHASILTQDGLLANYVTFGKAHQDVNNFFLLPLDSSLLTCERYTPGYTLIDTTLELHRMQPGVEAVPTRVLLEDIHLKRRVRTFTSEVICEDTYALEDYRISIQDTICASSGTMEIAVEVCRNDNSEQQSVSLDFYEASPLEVNTMPFIEEEVNFAIGQTCVQKSYFIQNSDVHLMLNGSTETARPYTLKKTFFDGHEQMEYDYTNNQVSIAACENTVPVVQTKTQSVSLALYPNPTSSSLNVSVNTGVIESVFVYNSLGVKVYT